MSETLNKTIDTAVRMEEAFSMMGMSMYSPDLSAKLLAYLYVFGGSNEAVTQNAALNFAMRCAQKKANLNGGEIPNPEMVPLIQQRIQECADGTAGEWIKYLCDRYSLKWFSFYSEPVTEAIPFARKKKPTNEFDLTDLLTDL